MRQLMSSNGTDLVAFAMTGILVLIISLIYVWWIERSSGKLSCPGIQPKDPMLGNLCELTKKGGLHQFLMDYHERLGPIFSFFWGKDIVVSIASPSLFKDVSTLFDRPVEQFESFRPLIGDYSIQYINSPTGPKHRKIHDRQYSYSAIQSYFSEFTEIGKELVNKWKTINVGEHIPLTQHMVAIAIKSVVRTSFGKEYFKTNKEILELQEAYHYCWDDMEERINGNMPEPGSERQIMFDEYIEFMHNKIKAIIHHRQSVKDKTGTQNFLDVLLEEEEMYPTDEHIIGIFITYLVGGFHTSGYLLSWALYFLCLHPEVEEKVYREIVEVLGDEEMTVEHCKKLNYMEMVINESLRCSVLATSAVRSSPYDMRIGGHIIPKETPIVMALGVVAQDATIWPEPRKFNPERFNPEQVNSRDSLAFQPFGFAGKRKCPAYRFAYYEAYAFLTSIIRNFKVKLVPDQQISYRHGLVTQFTEEVWVTAEQR